HQCLPDRRGDGLVPGLQAHHRRDPRLDDHGSTGAPARAGRAAGAAMSLPGSQSAVVPRSRAGLILLASITVLWGCNWPVLKIAVTELPVFTFRSISLMIGVIGMFIVCRIEGKPWSLPRRDVLPCFFVAMTTITGWNLASTLGLLHMAPGRASILAFTMPLWAALLAVPMLKERMTGLRVLGLALGLAGMAMLIWPDRANLARDPLGPIYMIAAAVLWALGTV